MLTLTDTASNVNRFGESVVLNPTRHIFGQTAAHAGNMGLNESGGAVLRWTIFRIFELWCFVESAVLKCPAFVKPRTVTTNAKKTDDIARQ